MYRGISMPQSAGPEPGWYFTEDDAGVERYWNGTDWTEHRRAKKLAEDDDKPDPPSVKAAPSEAIKPPAPPSRTSTTSSKPSPVGDSSLQGLIPPKQQQQPVTARTDRQFLEAPKRSQSGARGFWSSLSTGTRIGIIALFVVPIVLVYAVLSAAISANSPSRDSGSRSSGSTSTTTTRSYSAGYEQGQSLQRGALANGGTVFTSAEANNACDLFLSGAEDLGYFRWSGGTITISNLDRRDFHRGCLAGIEAGS